jgi:chromosome segregation ATPase
MFETYFMTKEEISSCYLRLSEIIKQQSGLDDEYVQKREEEDVLKKEIIEIEKRITEDEEKEFKRISNEKNSEVNTDRSILGRIEEEREKGIKLKEEIEKLSNNKTITNTKRTRSKNEINRLKEKMNLISKENKELLNILSFYENNVK